MNGKISKLIEKLAANSKPILLGIIGLLALCLILYAVNDDSNKIIKFGADLAPNLVSGIIEGTIIAIIISYYLTTYFEEKTKRQTLEKELANTGMTRQLLFDFLIYETRWLKNRYKQKRETLYKNDQLYKFEGTYERLIERIEEAVEKGLLPEETRMLNQIMISIRVLKNRIKKIGTEQKYYLEKDKPPYPRFRDANETLIILLERMIEKLEKNLNQSRVFETVLNDFKPVDKT